jgi:RHS repeat-associated protein
MTPLLTVADDANGNTLSDPSGKQYTWDFENRLTQAVVPGTNGGTTTFKYDPFGRRIQKSGPLGTTNYLYDGPNAMEELDGAGNVLARYTHGTVVDEPLAELRSGATSYYHADNLGSVTSLTDSTGTVANTYTYDGYGKVSASTGTLTNPFRFNGHEFDSETQLHFYRARYYDQSVGRFISEDPFGFSGSNDFYAYVDNSPTNLIDPLAYRPRCQDHRLHSRTQTYSITTAWRGGWESIAPGFSPAIRTHLRTRSCRSLAARRSPVIKTQIAKSE